MIALQNLTLFCVALISIPILSVPAMTINYKDVGKCRHIFLAKFDLTTLYGRGNETLRHIINVIIKSHHTKCDD